MIVIHPYDITTRFLDILYKDSESVTVIDEKNDYDEVFDILEASPRDEIIMTFAHGTGAGLYASTPEEQMGRFIIDRDYTEILRQHTCVGIRCYANLFVERYQLKGLFSGMVISEVSEADIFNIPATAMQISKENDLYAQRLKELFRNQELEDVPEQLRQFITPNNPIQEFNYKSLYYYP